ncbi:MAG: hypothetical protein K8U03_10355 [Planctomycetia bacterium]|nr:hypothetical protein [Planctomycetia bacterium]
MKVVYSLFASLVVGAIVLPMSLAQTPNTTPLRYPSMAQSTIEVKTARSAAPTPTPKPASTGTASKGTLPTGTPTTITAPSIPVVSTPAPSSPTPSTPVSNSRIVTETRPTTTLPTNTYTLPPHETATTPIVLGPTQHVPLSLGALTPTPEMWFYEQMRQDYNNPQLQVRRNSERAAAERKARIASCEWYGVSPSRPMAYTTPHMYHYSPTWASNSRRPYYWGGTPTTAISIDARQVPAMGVSGIGTW